MDALTTTYAQFRKAKGILRKTGTVTVEQAVADDGTLTLTGKGKDAKVRLKATIDPAGNAKITKKPAQAAKGAKVADDGDGDAAAE